MNVQQAISKVSQFGRVRSYQDEYRAKVGPGSIAFRDEGGRCGRLRVTRGGRSWSRRSVTGALRDALHQVGTLPTAVGLLSARIERQGRSLTPFAAFILTTIENQDLLRVKWAEDGWADDEALRMAQTAIEGTLSPALLLKWLERRGANIASFLRPLGDGQESRPTATAAAKDTRS